jgi:hypothetical protein
MVTLIPSKFGCVTAIALCRSSRVFRSFDKDSNRAIGAGEFLAILQALDPTLVMQDVEKAFRLVRANATLNEELFWQWCIKMFGDFSDTEFRDQLMELIVANPSAEKRAW